MIATLNLLGLLRKPTLWRTSTPTNDSLERTCNQSQHSWQSGLIHSHDYLLSIYFASTLMHLLWCIFVDAFSPIVDTDLIENADGFHRKHIHPETFSRVNTFENGALSYQSRRQNEAEHCWSYHDRINVDDRRKRIDEKALHRKRSSVDGALNSKFTTVWSKCRFWPIFENALEVFPVLFIQQKKWKHPHKHVLSPKEWCNKRKPGRENSQILCTARKG